ncbi:MAG: pyridoxal-phosphate dependent enzyme [Verrucomicrobia bacterium]|nr:pyridoxal-phosphate dependent enzyme [Verrucomicrobiota bacterium]
MKPLPTLTEIESAAAGTEAVVPPTPQFTWPLLNARAGCEVWVKHENHTAIGSFKIHGGLQYAANLRKRQPQVPGVIAATRGNFGQAVAYAARSHRLPAVIVVPRGNSVEKNAAMRVYFTDTHNVAEGPAGGALAALLKETELNAGHRVGVVLSGGKCGQGRVRACFG